MTINIFSNLRIIPLVISLISVCFSAIAYEPEWALYGVHGSEFHDGLAVSRDKILYGYIGTNGEWAIPPKFKNADDFKRGTAIVTDTDDNIGIIDIYGNYTLPPGNYKISNILDAPGYYIVENKDTNKEAVYDGRRFLTTFDYSNISTLYFPLLIIDKNNIFNLKTLEFMTDATVIQFGKLGYIVSSDKDFTYKLYSFDGEPLDTTQHKISSKGNEIFLDETTGKYGIRNAETKKIIAEPRYTLHPKLNYYKLWNNDVVELFDSISPQQKSEMVFINQDGKKILQEENDYYMMMKPDYIVAYYTPDWGNDSKIKYFDFKGKEIKDMIGSAWYDDVYPGIYRSSDNSFMFFDTRKKIKNAFYPRVSEGVIKYEDTANDKYYYFVIESGLKLGPYDNAKDFSEGIAVVKKGQEKFFIDKKGKEYHLPDGLEIYPHDKFSEGVIGVEDKLNHKDGYIYNPLGNHEFSYNQKDSKINDYMSARLINEGHKLFDQEKYAQAMDKYYQCMMIDPLNNYALNNYAACLYNLHHYEQALTAIEVVLDEWPGDEFAINLHDSIVRALEKQQAIQEENDYTENQNSSTSIWDALGNFANTLVNITGQYASMGTDAYYQSSINPETVGGGVSTPNTSNGNYETEYRRWESLAERHYNSLTNLGYSATSKKGNKSGNSGSGKVSPGNYVQQKRAFREAQQKMRSIRQKAAQNGVTIQKSRWETATVSY